MKYFAIKKILNDDELQTSLQIIRESFAVVAANFALTKENAPTHGAFSNECRLHRLKGKGAVFFGAYLETQQIGFVAVEKSNESVYFMERLAVLPQYRHQGIGSKLVEFVFDYVREVCGTKISIGIIDKNITLKHWYQHFGFQEVSDKEYSHLPFKVCFMEKDLRLDFT